MFPSRWLVRCMVQGGRGRPSEFDARTRMSDIAEAKRDPMRRRRLTLWAIAAGVLALLAVVAGAGSSPSACVSCHTVAQSTGAHADAACYDCHLEQGTWSLPGAKAHELFGMYPAALVGREARDTSGMRVGRTPCLECHDAVLGQVVSADGLRIDHASCAPAPRLCSDCHDRAGHVASEDGGSWTRTPVMEECVACHESEKAPAGCDTCHEGRLERDRLARGPWQITHGPTWRTTHGMGTLSGCRTCHDEAFCGKCHGVGYPHGADFGRTHGAKSRTATANCVSCHKSEQFCADCHGVAMPHPDGFLKQHPSTTDGVDDRRCVTCHPQDDCARCHERHIHPGGANGLPVPRKGPGT